MRAGRKASHTFFVDKRKAVGEGVALSYIWHMLILVVVAGTGAMGMKARTGIGGLGA